MIRNLCVYLAVLLVTFYWFFLYDGNSASWLLALEVLYPFFSMLYIRLVSGRMEISPVQGMVTGEQGKTMRIGFRVTDHSKARSVKYRLRISIRNHFSGKVTKHWIHEAVADGADDRIWYTFVPQDCGCMEIAAGQLRIYDFLGIFYRSMKCSQQVTAAVWPAFNTVPLEITRRTREFPAEADEYSTERSGEDPAEIYQIREYQEQDSIHNIHWKLSAKADMLMVKENGWPLGCVVLLWIDLVYIGTDGRRFGQLLEKTAAISMTLTEEKCIHMVAWFEEKNRRVVKWKVDSEESVYTLIQRLSLQEPCRDQNLSELYYEEAFRGAAFGSIVCIRGIDEVLVNGEKQEILRL